MPRSRTSALARGLGAAWPLLLALACASPSAAEPPAERIPLSIDAAKGEVTYQVELADTPAERERGLMHRTAMSPEHGMLFLFPVEEQQSFWMRNTHLSLDLIFIRADRTILGIVERATPRTDTPRRVAGKSQFVLELLGGQAAARGIAPGQTVRFYAPLPSS